MITISTLICSDKSLVTNELSGDNYAKAMKALFPNIQEHIGAAVDSPPSNDSDEDSKENDEGNSGDEGSEGGQNNDLTKAYNYLFRMVLLKDIIAESIWLLLAGSLAITIETNMITGIECDYDPEAMKAIKKKAEETHKASQKKPMLQTIT